MFGQFKKKVNNAIGTVSEKVSEREIKKSDLEDILWDLQVSLFQSDVAVETAEKIADDIEEELVGQQAKRRKIEKIIRDAFHDSVKSILGQGELDLVKEIKNGEKPVTVLFLGFNGSGKTTTLAKFAHTLKQEDLSLVFAAGDTYRAASIEQISQHGDKLDVKVVKHDYGADAAAVVYDAFEHAKSEKKDVVLADSAGRSHSDANLMDELKKICRVNEPDYKILVLDSLTGNDVVEQAKKFEEAVGVDGIILSKMDVNEKGGAALSVAHSIEKPILYIGVGQEYDDLERFDPEDMIERILE
ncbi:MAG: signal recognition particle-docking protein FtsY [Candidatus Aenigmatarchaeota archaeon]